MNILDIAIAKKLAGGGGGSGTDNYNDLSNLPKINDTTLSGNKTSANLGLQSEINSDSKLASDLVDDTNQDNKFVTSSEKSTWNGKQNAIDADHKINADYVDDSTSTNKFVTATDKETWNAKQNAIDSSHKLSSDLVDDTNHTNKFVTSTEKQTWNGKQNAIDSDHKLSSSLVSFTTAEAAALASGIDSTKVGQISTNQTNILLVKDAAKELADKGAKNLLPKLKSYTDSGLSMVINDDNSITAKWSATDDSTLYARINDNNWTLPRGTYVLSGMPNNSNIGCYIHIETNTSQRVVDQERKTPVEFTIANDYEYLKIYISIRPNSAAETSGVTILPMIVTKAISDIGADSYVPPALPNYDLTRLEAEDRASLAELVDSGAKNLIDFSELRNNINSSNNITATNTGNGVSVATTQAWSYVSYKIALAKGSYYMSCKISDLVLASGTIASAIRISSNNDGTGTFYGSASITANGVVNFEINAPSDINCYITLYLNASSTAKTQSYTITDVMICTKAAFGVSSKFVPYRPNWDLVSSVAPFYSVPINHNMIYRGQNLGATFTDAQHTALSSGNFTDLFLGDYWTKSVTIPAGTYTGGDGEEVTVAAQTVTLKAVIADFDTFYAGYASSHAGINTHHAGVIVTGFDNVVWNKTSSTAGGYVSSLIHKWLVGSVLPQIETWFGSAKVLSHQKLLTNAITGDAASGWAWSSQKISLLSENQMYGSKVWGGSKATNGAYEPGEAHKHLNVFNHIAPNMLFGNKSIWCRDIASAAWSACLIDIGIAYYYVASSSWIAPAALILLS